MDSIASEVEEVAGTDPVICYTGRLKRSNDNPACTSLDNPFRLARPIIPSGVSCHLHVFFDTVGVIFDVESTV